MLAYYLHRFTAELTISMQQNPSCETKVYADNQENPYILWRPDVGMFIVGHMVPLISFFEIHFNIIPPPIPKYFKSCSSSRFRTKTLNLFIYSVVYFYDAVSVECIGRLVNS
jgi:hypothetical protein